MFKCKGANKILQTVTWTYINRGWVPVITICKQNLYKQIYIPRVLNLELEATGSELGITWHPNSYYYTEIQYKNEGDEEWTVLPLVDKGVGSI